MRRLLLVVVLGLAACGPTDERIDMCGSCSPYPEGSCADLDGMGQAICTSGTWKLDLQGTCLHPVCAVQFPHTYRGEEPWCHWDKGSCR